LPTLVAYLRKKQKVLPVFIANLFVFVLYVLIFLTPGDFFMYADLCISPLEMIRLDTTLRDTLWVVLPILLTWSFLKGDKTAKILTGILLLAGGLLVWLYIINLETDESWEFFINKRLEHQRIGLMIFPAMLCIMGVILLVTGFVKNKKQVQNITTASVPTKEQPDKGLDELEKLFSLKERGAITEEEYEAKKQRLLK